MKQSEEPAFPYTDAETFAYNGVSKREYFAALAMQGILANKDFSTFSTIETAKLALEMADKLLETINTPDKPPVIHPSDYDQIPGFTDGYIG